MQTLPPSRAPRFTRWHPGLRSRRLRRSWVPRANPTSLSHSTNFNITSELRSEPQFLTNFDLTSEFGYSELFLSFTTNVRFSSSVSITGTPILYSQLNAARSVPMSFAQAPTGELYMATGLGPALVWDGFANSLFPVGIDAPTQAPVIAGSGLGDIVGSYTAYVRFLDAQNNPTDLSPVSDEVDVGNSSGTITNVTTGTPPAVTSAAHGLTTGATVNISGVVGLSGVNGTKTIAVVDADTFNLDNTTSTGTYTSGGTWSSGSGSIVYTNVQVPSDPRIVTKQIIRNTSGQASVYYVDVETQEIQTTTFTSTNSDDTLQAGISVPLFTTEGAPLANRFGTPPPHKAILVNHQGRMFLLGEWEYGVGSVAVTFGSKAVTGIGTEWNSAFVGRFLYVYGSNAAYEIDTVDPDSQTLQLLDTYTGQTNPYADYSIRPAPAERRLIYYNESDTSQAWPVTNAVALNEDGDEITGGLSKGSFLFILERRHIYRSTFQVSPVDDGGIFLSVLRGCVNFRSWVLVEDNAYMLDEYGVHAFSGGASVPTSLLISDIFRPSAFPLHINWARSKFFHAAHFPAQETIRWFVVMGGGRYPHHALAYSYRHQRWWIETYPMPICASTPMLLDLPRTIVGGEAQKVYSLWGGNLDVADGSLGTVQGTVTSAGLTWLADSTAVFPESRMVGAPVAIAAGTGKGQLRLIASVDDATLNVTQPWLVQPDTTSQYLVGAIAWQWRSGAFRYNDRQASSEEDSVRRVELQFQPKTHGTTLDIKIYEDFSSEPVEYDIDMRSTDGGGLSFTRGSSAVTVDMTKDLGFVQLRLDAHKEINTDGPRWMSVDLSGFAGQDGVAVQGLVIDGVIKGGQ